jgi:hypothetical protein
VKDVEVNNMKSFVCNPLSPAIAFILAGIYLVCLAKDLKNE